MYLGCCPAARRRLAGSRVGERPFTAKTAAEHLACSTSHVRRLCREGKLRHFRLGGDERGPIRITPDALGEFVRCASSGSAADGMPMSEPLPEPDDTALAPRIVRLRNVLSKT